MGKGKIWPSADPKPLNRSSPNLNHVITSRTSTAKKKIWAQSVQGVLLPYTWNIHPQTYVYFTFFGSSPRLPARPLDGFWRSIRHTTRFCAKEVPFGGLENLNLILNLFIPTIKTIRMATIGKFKKKSNCHTFGCIQDRVVITRDSRNCYSAS